MPLATDLQTVGAVLDRDRAWAAYAIGDLAPGFVEHCEWHIGGADALALILVYRGCETPIVFSMGDVRELRPLFAEITAGNIALHLQPEALQAMRGVYAPTHTRAMRRMVLDPAKFRDRPRERITVLQEDDLDAIVSLYESAQRLGDGPTFFHPTMLRQGTFHGLWINGELVSAAGTHLYSPELGVCAIGNVYTRQDCRGRGFGAQVTAAVVAHAIDQGVSTIVLNVGSQNVAAQRVYSRLGFTHYCDFLEGEASRLT